ncbi:MAG: ATP-binding protein [Firmicutes bacterium]|nr:ATP-binding protein [Bacillota bacterium]
MLSKLSIKNRFVTTGVFILTLLVSFMIFLIIMINQLAEVPLKIVDHPLQVSNAAYFANIEVLRMQNNLDDIILADEGYEISILIDKINSSEERVYESLELIESFILGVEGKVLQAEAKRLLQSWKPIRVELIEAVKSGDEQKALRILKTRDDEHAENLERKLVELNSYARNKANQFQEEVLQLEERLKFWSIFGIVLVITGVFIGIIQIGSSVLFSIGSLSTQLKNIMTSGEMKKVSLSGNDELVELSDIFNDLVSSLNNQLWVKEGNKRLFTILNRIELPENILNDYIIELSSYCDFISCAYYHSDGEKLKIRSTQNRLLFMEDEFDIGSGIIGECARRNVVNTIDYSQKLISMKRDFPYNYISVIPVSSEHKVYGVLVVVTMEKLSLIENEYLDSGIKDLRIYLENIEQRKQIDSLLEDSIKTNQELVIRQEELEQFNNYKNQFFANVSHELKTPLNSIIILSNILNSKKVSNFVEEDNEKIEIINNAAIELLKIINNILDLSKIESGKIEKNEEIFSVNKFMDKLENLYRPIINDKGLKCNFIVQEDCTLYGDQEKIYHIVSNLISNAIKFTDKGSVEIIFRIEYDDYPVKFEVIDTGIGIAEDKKNLIFDEFIQSDGTISRTYGGTGLGLSICKSYASLLEGKVEVSSELGVGSTFVLMLPDYYIASKDSNNEIIIDNNDKDYEVHVGEYTDKKIVVCDDEPYNLFAIASILEDFGVEPITVSNVYDAIEKLDTNTVDMIFMDLMMPEHDGLEALEMIKERKSDLNIPMVIVTAAEVTATDLETINSSGYRIIKKPIVPKDIINLLDEFFS